MSDPLLEQPVKKGKTVHNFIDSHLQELRWTAYGLAVIGLTLVLKRIKATTRFHNAAQIPPHFITKNYRLQGHVRQVTDSGELLVEHIPIITLAWLRGKHTQTQSADQGLLHVTLAGVDLSPDAIKWCTDTVHNSHVWFRLLEVTGSSVDCDVTLRQGRMRRSISLSKEVVSRGLCSVKHFEKPPTVQVYDRLLVDLLALEQRAQNKNKGIWHEEKEKGWFTMTMLSCCTWTKHRLKLLYKRKEK